MNSIGRKFLILACGNTLRSDDGVGWKIAEVLEEDKSLVGGDIIATHQLTPELSEAVSRADTVIFVDSSTEAPPGVVTSVEIAAKVPPAQPLTHYTDPASLLALTRELYNQLPHRSFVVTVGGASFELSEKLTDVVRMAVPAAAAEVKRILADRNV